MALSGRCKVWGLQVAEGSVGLCAWRVWSCRASSLAAISGRADFIPRVEFVLVPETQAAVLGEFRKVGVVIKTALDPHVGYVAIAMLHLPSGELSLPYFLSDIETPRVSNARLFGVLQRDCKNDLKSG